MSDRVISPTFGTLIHRFNFDDQVGDKWADSGSSTGITRTFGSGQYGTYLEIAGSGGRGTILPSTFFNITEDGWSGGNLDLEGGDGVGQFACGILTCELDENDDPTAAGSNKINQLTIRYNDTTTGGTLYQGAIWNIGNSRRKGLVQIPFSAYTLCNAGANPIDDVAKVWITAAYNSNYNGFIRFYDLSFYEPLDTKGRIMIRIDDTLDEHIGHAQVANVRNVPCNFAFYVTGTATEHPNYLTMSQVNEIRDMSVGHKILNHMARVGGVDNGDDFGWVYTDSGQGTFTNINDKRINAIEARNFMRASGHKEFMDAVVVPGGYEGNSDKDLIDDGTVTMLWYTVGSSVQDPEVIYPWPLSSGVVQELSTNNLWDGDSVTSMNSDVDAAVNSKGLFIAHFHSVGSGDFATVCDHIANHVSSGNLEVVTIQNLVNPYSYPIRDVLYFSELTETFENKRNKLDSTTVLLPNGSYQTREYIEGQNYGRTSGNRLI